MFTRSTFIIPLVLLSIIVNVEAADKCPPKLIKAFKALDARLKSAEIAHSTRNKLAQLQKIKEETLKPVMEHIGNAYKKGQDLSKLKYEMMDLKRIPTPSQAQIDRMAQIEQQYLSIQKEITDINNKYIAELHKIYNQEGIPALIVAREDGSNVLKLNFAAPPTKKTAYEFYRRVQSRFGLKEVTLSLKENAEAGFGGFFSSYEQRIDMGPGQGMSMLDDYFNSVSKHESRHSMFFHKRAVGDDSIFHTQFFASPDGNLLNGDKMYDTYMSSEEVYTFSTDLQSLAQAFSRDIITDVPQKMALIDQITDHTQMFRTVAKSTQKVTADMITSLDGLWNSGKPSQGMFVELSETGQISLNFGDKLNRRSEIIMVSEAEKQLAHKMLNAQIARSQYMDKYVTDILQKSGVNVQLLSFRIQQGLASADEMTSLQKYAMEALESSKGKKLTAELDQAAKPMLKNARENMVALNRLSGIQYKEGEKIEQTLAKIHQLKDKITDIEITELKHQLFETAKNVKEDYRGFALNPK